MLGLLRNDHGGEILGITRKREINESTMYLAVKRLTFRSRKLSKTRHWMLNRSVPVIFGEYLSSIAAETHFNLRIK